MFKLICEIEKFTAPEASFTGIKYKNCQPCEFSDYQMFDEGDEINISTSRVLKATLTAITLEKSALDITKPEYTNLANKLYYIDDFSDYRYITIFDESTQTENVINIFGVPWIYSAIIRHIKPDTTSAIIHDIWDALSSQFTNSQPNENTQEERFKTIWQKYFLFSLPSTVNHDRLLGTIQKNDYNDGSGKQYYAIDSYFLKYLFLDKHNSKCIHIENNIIPALINDEQSTTSNSLIIYNHFKSQLPKLLGLNYLGVLNKIRSCVHLETGKTTVLYDQTDKFALNSLNKVESFNAYTLIEACKQLGGILAPIQMVVDRALSYCAKNKNKALSSILDGYNLLDTSDLYELNCNTIEEVFQAIGNITDYYEF